MPATTAGRNGSCFPDLLGVTALVEEINARGRGAPRPTRSRGPFYRPTAPRLRSWAPTSRSTASASRLDGDRAVSAISTASRSAGATIETWQANAEGFYENQQPDLQPEFNLARRVHHRRKGRFRYRTVRPAGYAARATVRSASCLAAAGYPLRRPAHLHFLVKAEGFETISTHVYDGATAARTKTPCSASSDEPDRRLHAGSRQRRWALDFTLVMVAAAGRTQARHDAAASPIRAVRRASSSATAPAPGRRSGSERGCNAARWSWPRRSRRMRRRRLVEARSARWRRRRVHAVPPCIRRSR